LIRPKGFGRAFAARWPAQSGRSFERICKTAGLRQIRLHDLRHTTATLLKALGVPPRDAMGSLGHSRIAVTLQACTAGDEHSRREAIGKLADLSDSQAG
jgi:integrase